MHVERRSFHCSVLQRRSASRTCSEGLAAASSSATRDRRSRMYWYALSRITAVEERSSCGTTARSASSRSLMRVRRRFSAAWSI